MFFGLGIPELLLVLALPLIVVVGLVWIVRRLIYGTTHHLAPPPQRSSAAELEATRKRLAELEARVGRTEEKVEFTERLIERPHR